MKRAMLAFRTHFSILQKEEIHSMYTNTELAESVLGRLVKAYRAKEYPFDLPSATAPQNKENMPGTITWGSREHALFLFTLCYWMRGGIDSHTATRQLSSLYKKRPDIFLPENAVKIDSKEVSREAKSHGLGFNSDQIGVGGRKTYSSSTIFMIVTLAIS